jgi:hypothetical protein
VIRPAKRPIFCVHRGQSRTLPGGRARSRAKCAEPERHDGERTVTTADATNRFIRRRSGRVRGPSRQTGSTVRTSVIGLDGFPQHAIHVEVFVRASHAGRRRQLFQEGADGRVGPATAPGWVKQAIGQGQIFRRDYSNIRVPVLALNRGFAPDATTDDVLKAFHYAPKTDADRAAIDRFMAASAVVFGRWTDKLKRGAPNVRLVYYPNAGHYVYMTNEADVLREIHAFVAGLAPLK